MPQMTESELKKQIDACQFSSLYFFYGPETYLIQQYTDRLLRKANPPFPDFNLQRFDGREASVDDIADAAEALPFLAERKFVTVSDLDVESRSASDLGKLYELLENLPSSATLLFYCPGVEVDGKKSAKWKKWIGRRQQGGGVGAHGAPYRGRPGKAPLRRGGQALLRPFPGKRRPHGPLCGE